MILNNTADVDYCQEDESIDFSIDTENLGVLFKGFSDNLYSNKIGSIVREYASNACDANTESGTDLPVVITMISPSTTTPGQIIFEDFGPGLSPSRVRDVFSKYFSSTKRNSNNEIGGYGIGSKSAFSVFDSFQIITRVDGTEYHYVMHKGLKAPQITRMLEMPTDKPNGTQIILPIKDRLQENDFEQECMQQLRYFENIDYVGFRELGNDYELVQGENWIYRTDATYRGLEACVGRVRYPLDGEVIRKLFGSGYYNYNLNNFAVRFEVGELDVTMSRESIDYNERTLEAIKKRMLALKEEFDLLYSKSNVCHTPVELMKQVLYASNQVGDSMLFVEDKLRLNTNGISKKPMPVYQPFVDMGLTIRNYSYGKVWQHNPFFFCEPFKQVSETYGSSVAVASIRDLLITKVPVYRIKGKHSAIKDAYILSGLSGYKRFITIRDRWSELKSGDNLVSQNSYEDQQTYYAHITEWFEKLVPSYDDLVVPKEFMDSQKPRKTVEPLEGEFTVKEFTYSPHREREIQYTAHQMYAHALLDTVKSSRVVIYGSEKDSDLLNKVGCLLHWFYPHGSEIKSNRARVYKLTERECKGLKGYKGFVRVTEFVNPRNKWLMRMLTNVYWANQIYTQKLVNDTGWKQSFYKNFPFNLFRMKDEVSAACGIVGYPNATALHDACKLLDHFSADFNHTSVKGIPVGMLLKEVVRFRDRYPMFTVIELPSDYYPGITEPAKKVIKEAQNYLKLTKYRLPYQLTNND